MIEQASLPPPPPPQSQQHSHHHESSLSRGSDSIPNDDEDVGGNGGGEDPLNLKGGTMANDQDMEDDEENEEDDDEELEDGTKGESMSVMKRRTMGTTGEEEDAHHSSGVSPMKKKLKLEVPPGPVVATVSESSADSIKSEEMGTPHHPGSVLGPVPPAPPCSSSMGPLKSEGGGPPPPPGGGGSPNRTSSPLLRPSPAANNSLHSSNANGLIRVPHDHDVLCGRGGDINSHPGNRKFRAWVSERREAYNLAQSRSEKAKIPREIVDLVRSQSPPGRFLIREDKVNHRTASTSSNNAGEDDAPPAANNNSNSKEGTGSWIQIDDARAVAKTSQALREGAPVIRATLERARTAPSLQGRGVSLEGASGGPPPSGTPPGGAPPYPGMDGAGGGGGMRGDGRSHGFRSPSDPPFPGSGANRGGGSVGMLGYHPDHAAAAAAVGMAAAAAAGPPPPYGKLRRNTSHPAHPWDAQRSGYTEAVESGFLRPMRLSHPTSGKDKSGAPPKPQSAAAIREKEETVAQWLMQAVPSLHRDDVESYSQRLVRDGFDSIVMLDNELLEEDLDFMKKAHRRALLRNKAARNGGGGGNVPPPSSGTPPPSCSTSSTP